MVLQLVVLVLVLLLGLLWRRSAVRFQEMEGKIAELTEVKEELQRLLAAQEQEKAAESGPSPAGAEEKRQESAPERPAKAMVALGQRQPVAVVSRPMAVVPKGQVPANVPADITPEIVAVIMAAVAAYGYSPASIRSIRKSRGRSSRWALAGRLAAMR